MFKAITDRIRTDGRVKWILALGVLIQFLTALTAIGTYHPDQHFAVIEFGLYLMGRPNGAFRMWEVDAQLLPSLKMYGFAGYLKLMEALHVNDHYTMLTILRVVVSMLNLSVFAGIILYNVPAEKKTALHSALFLLCFSWCFPYVRTAYSAELLSATFFFGACLFYQYHTDKGSAKPWHYLLTGLLFGLAFYCRFQIAFAGIGFLTWVFLTRKRYGAGLAWIAMAFLAVAALNTWLDSQLYHQLVFTPERYFRVNIMEGKASTFGTNSVLFYVSILAGVLLAPPISIYLFATCFRPLFTKWKDLYVLCTFFFVLAHSLVGHKEDRFLFPVFGLLPLLSGYALDEIKPVYEKRPRWLKGLMKGTLAFSLFLNFLLLILFLFVPYAQGIHFGKQVHDQFLDQRTPLTVYCLERDPFLTESKNDMVFYREALNPNIRFVTQKKLKPLMDSLGTTPFYLLTTYNDLHRDSTDANLLRGSKPLMTSTGIIWSLNEFLNDRGMNTINEIWAMYRVNEH
jgi:phosphatidylinositol glycan class B